MNRTVGSACRQAFTGRAFFAAVAGTVLILGIGAFQDVYKAVIDLGGGLLENGFHRAIAETALASDTMAFALPILSALPCTPAYLDDLRSGFIKEYLPRTRKRDYIAAKLFSCLLSGGFALVLGILLFYGAAALAFTPMEAALAEGAEREAWLAPLSAWCLRAFCSGAFWSLVGMTLSAATDSRYMAYASPFIIYYVLVILSERYFKKVYVLYPKEWLVQEKAWVGGVWGVAALLFLLTAVCALCFVFLAKRRLDRL